MGPRSVFYPNYLSSVMSMFNFRINVLEAVQVADDVWFPIFCGFRKPVIIHSVYMASSCSSPDSGSSYDVLNLTDVADVFVADFIPQNVASDAP